VCAGDGADVIRGRPGGSDKVRGAAGYDRIYTFFGDDVIFGGPGPDEVLAEGQGKGNDVLYGGAGNDYLAEREGDDRLNGGTGADVMRGLAGTDVLQGGRGDDSLAPGKGRDVLRGGRDEDSADYWESGHPIRASLVDDKALGEGLDTLHGIEGLFGSAFDDHLIGDGGSNELSGGAGTLRHCQCFRSGSDVVVGGAGDDVIDGTWNFTGQGDGRDKLGGGRGDDLISGGPNDDTLIGGPGTDTSSAQRCIFCGLYRYGFSSPVLVNLKLGLRQSRFESATQLGRRRLPSAIGTRSAFSASVLARGSTAPPPTQDPAAIDPIFR
jgi:Ca2+-binding RTX toxin-like protein